MLDERSLRRIAGMWQKPGASIDTDEVTFVDYTSWMQARAEDDSEQAVIRCPAQFASCPEPVQVPARALGLDTAAILRELGTR